MNPQPPPAVSRIFSGDRPLCPHLKFSPESLATSRKITESGAAEVLLTGCAALWQPLPATISRRNATIDRDRVIIRILNDARLLLFARRAHGHFCNTGVYGRIVRLGRARFRLRHAPSLRDV